MLNFFWRFTCQSENKQEFLNCEIKTDKRKVFYTNKCFVASMLESMNIPVPPESEDSLTIVMPKYSQEELRNLLSGFITYKSEDTSQISMVEVECSSKSNQSNKESSICVALDPKEQDKPQKMSVVHKEENCKTTGGDELEGERRTFVRRGVFSPSNPSSGQPQKKKNLVGSKNPSSSPKTFLCDFCGKEFSASRKLKDHRYRVHSSTTYVCGVCGKEFKNNCNLTDHLITHKEPSFSCQFCLKVTIEHFAQAKTENFCLFFENIFGILNMEMFNALYQNRSLNVSII